LLGTVKFLFLHYDVVQRKESNGQIYLLILIMALSGELLHCQTSRKYRTTRNKTNYEKFMLVLLRGAPEKMNKTSSKPIARTPSAAS
jgi:hypothetical protein